MRKHYAVARGRRTGIFRTWSECEQQVKGFPNARFKSFQSREDAKMFVAAAGKCASASAVALSQALTVCHTPDRDSVSPPKRSRSEHPTAGASGSVRLDAAGEIVIVGRDTEHPAASTQQSTRPASKSSAETKQTAGVSSLCAVSVSTESPGTNAEHSPFRRYRLFADGGARGNPGIAGCGYVLLDGGVDGFATPVESPSDVDGRTVEAGGEWVGAHETNNTAEYRGLIRGLSRAVELCGIPVGSVPAPAAGLAETGVPGEVDLSHGIDIFLDSNLVVQQVSGKWDAKKPHLRALRDEVWRLLRRFDSRRVGSVHPKECQWNIRHIRREHNQRADTQANLAMDRGPPSGTAAFTTQLLCCAPKHGRKC